MSTGLFGQRIKRREDPRFLTGTGRYVADLQVPGTVHAAILRSPHAHARIVRVDVGEARRAPGVLFAGTARDLGPFARPLPQVVPHPALRSAMPMPLAVDRVRFAGEAVAVVVAGDRYQAEDALEHIRVEYEPLPAVANPAKALAPDAPVLHEALGDNLAARWSVRSADVDAALATADHVLRERFVIVRGTAAFLETRGLHAVPDATGKLTLWASCQTPHTVHEGLVPMLGLSPHQVRVVAPDVGGGFGPKGLPYPEDYLVSWLALHLARPVKWIEDRREDFLATVQEREQIHEVEFGFRRDGTLVALRDRILADNGAYALYGIVTPFLTTTGIMGQYKVPAFEAEMTVVYTNKVPVAPVRGAGRPQSAYVMDRLMDLAARMLSMDPAEIRFKNLIQKEEFPYRTGFPFPGGAIQTFDSGDYPACLRKALEMADYPTLRKRQAEGRAQGRYLGIGIGGAVESTGIGPYEGATVTVDRAGGVLIRLGSGPQGQGHETSLAQVCADTLGVPLDRVAFQAADTEAVPFGIGTIASRMAAVGAPAVLGAAGKVRDKALSVAAGMLEARVDDLTIEDGKIFVQGSAGRSVTLAEVATVAAGHIAMPMPGGISPGLEATEYFNVTGTPFASSTNVAVVEVDPDSGAVKVLRYVVVHDCGRVINPLIVDGQIHGGVVHGLGNTLYEDILCSPEGQPLVTTFMDYLLPTAAESPPIAVGHLETPTPHNPLGIKGCGESGTISAPGTLAAAVEDALTPFGVRLRDLPLNPERIRALVAAARAGPRG
ncbi:MAG TPA: xanthine dehydrogenase family protein molybdopterin-binding subunit [Candidatus Methylomirabilis sp.]|jgi:carbon-monoxide dehydrogenase large subunit